MAARGLLRKSLFPPSLVSSLRYQLFFPLKTFILQAISKEKHFFKPLCWNVNEKCDVDVAIDRAGYQSKKQQGKRYSSGFLRSFYLASLTFGYVWYSSSTAYAANDDSEKENSAGSTLERCKGRFVSKGHLSAVKKLAKGKDNLKRPMAKEHKGEENDYEPVEKKMTRSKQVCFFYIEENCSKCCKLARIFIYYTTRLNTRANNCIFFSKQKTKN
jgi:hypothetical protein